MTVDTEIVKPIDDNTVQMWGLLHIRCLSSPIENIWLLWKYYLNLVDHVHICQVSTTGKTSSRIWMRFSIGNQHFHPNWKTWEIMIEENWLVTPLEMQHLIWNITKIYSCTSRFHRVDVFITFRCIEGVLWLCAVRKNKSKTLSQWQQIFPIKPMSPWATD